MSSVYVPFHSMYKAVSSYDNHYGYGRSDYDEDYESYDKWDSEFRRRRRGPSKRPRVRRLIHRALDNDINAISER